MEIVRTKEEINDVMEKCSDATERGTNYSGMSYEDGIMAVINWLSGDSDDHPFDE